MLEKKVKLLATINQADFSENFGSKTRNRLILSAPSTHTIENNAIWKLSMIALVLMCVCFNVDARRKTIRLRHDIPQQTTQRQHNVKNQMIEAEYAVMVDYETGERLLDIRADERCAPASMTKLMTLYLLFTAIKNGTASLEDEFEVSEEAQKSKGESRSFFQAGDKVKVEDLIRSIVVHSGNDACIIVAEGLFADVSLFVAEMNKIVEKFCLKNTHFMNPTGMPHYEHYSSCADLAIIARRIIKDFPEYYHYFSEKTFTINDITQPNRNILLGNKLNVDGLKTGVTNGGGYGMVASAVQHGNRLIAVVNGCKNPKSRAYNTNKLLMIGFKEFYTQKIAEAGQPISKAKVWLGTKGEVGVCTRENVFASIPKKFRHSLSVELKITEPIKAPIKLGVKLGELSYKYNNFTSKKYDVFACESIDKVGIFERATLTLKYLIFGTSN